MRIHAHTKCAWIPSFDGEAMHTPITLGVQELAELLGKTVNSTYTTLSRHPETLPTPLDIPGRATLIWLREDVLDWLKAHRAESHNRTTKSRRGAPTKCERMEAARHGTTVREMRHGNQQSGVARAVQKGGAQ
jgi:predicted DNA-binding transcriptional regulator AlpA